MRRPGVVVLGVSCGVMALAAIRGTHAPEPRSPLARAARTLHVLSRTIPTPLVPAEAVPAHRADAQPVDTGIADAAPSPERAPSQALRGPADVASAVVDLEGALGGPDFQPAAEGTCSGLSTAFEEDAAFLKDAVSRACDPRTDGEVRAVLIEALAAGRAAEVLSPLGPSLLLDPCPAVRRAALRCLVRCMEEDRDARQAVELAAVSHDEAVRGDARTALGW